MVSVRQLRVASLAGGSLEAGGAEGGLMPRWVWPALRRVADRHNSSSPFGTLDARGGGAVCRSCGQQERQRLALLHDLIAAGIEKPAYPSRRSRSLPPYLSATILPNLQIRRSYPSSGPSGVLCGGRSTRSDGSQGVWRIEAWFAAGGLRQATTAREFVGLRHGLRRAAYSEHDK